MRKLDGKIVRFIAVDRKYRSTPYPAIAPSDAKLNTYITGQHIDPSDPETKNNLTLKEITGEVEIKPAGRAKLFPHVINDEDPVMIIHNKGYNCKLDKDGNQENPKDYAEAHFIVLQDIVALNKNKVTSKHKFYLEDKEEDAKVFVNEADEVYEAEKLIREKAGVEDYKDLIMMLNLTVPGYYVSHHGMTDSMMKETLIRQARENPNSIKLAFTDEGTNYVFLAKLVENNIVKHKPGNGYYDGQKFIAIDAPSFVAFVHDDSNSEIVGKWGRILQESK